MTIAIHGGRLLDPASGLDGIGTVVIEGDRIADIRLGYAPPPPGSTTIDATGLLVLPGLIDLHVHCYTGATALGLPPDSIGVLQGVTTIADAGSAGPANIADFLAQTKDARTRVLAFLNISDQGLVRERRELANPAWLDPDAVIAALETHGDALVGVKARASASCVGAQGIAPIRVAKETAARAGVPLMVHIGNAPPALADVLNLLTEGDIVTHAFHGKPGGIYTDTGLLPEAERALARGVRFDVGHGQSSFSFATARRFLAEGRQVDIISSDLWRGNETGPVYSQLVTMSKLLHLGVPLTDVVAAATCRPADAVQRPELGRLSVGGPADVSIVRLAKGAFALTDSEGVTERAEAWLEPALTVRAGHIVRPMSPELITVTESLELDAGEQALAHELLDRAIALAAADNVQLDSQGRLGLAAHLASLNRRLQAGERMGEIDLSVFDTLPAVSRQLAIALLKPLYRSYSLDIDGAEIGLVATHFAAAMERGGVSG